MADGYAAVEDCARELKREAEEQEADPEELERIEERLQLFYKLKRKYGGQHEAVLEFYEKMPYRSWNFSPTAAKRRRSFLPRRQRRRSACLLLRKR